MVKEEVVKIFDDLDSYKEFCRNYGYVFNESDLYNNKCYTWRQYQKFISGKEVKNNWEVDLEKFKSGST